MKAYQSVWLIGGMVLIVSSLLFIPLMSWAVSHDPYEVNVNFRFTLRPAVTVITSPYRFLALVQKSVQESEPLLTARLIKAITSPMTFTRRVKEEIDNVQRQIASLINPIKEVGLPNGERTVQYGQC